MPTDLNITLTCVLCISVCVCASDCVLAEAGHLILWWCLQYAQWCERHSFMLFSSSPQGKCLGNRFTYYLFCFVVFLFCLFI